MFFIRKFCCRSVAKRSLKHFESFQGKHVDCNCNCVNKSTISTEATISGYKKDDALEKRGNIKVAIIGGGMAPVWAALFLKQSRLIKSINIADPKDTLAGAILDADHIDTYTRINYYSKKSITEALVDVDIVALMDETDFDIGREGPVAQFLLTSNYVREMSDYMAQLCPSALVAVFARPVTATLPMVSEVFKCARRWDPNRIVGSTAIDSMRIESMTASLFDLNPTYLSVPIVGGADPCTVVPLLTRARPINQFTSEHENALIHQLRAADKELASSVDGFKGPSMTTGVAASKFIVALASGLSGYPHIISSAYVRSDVLPVCRFFATELQFGLHGVEANLGLPKVSSKAINLIEQAIPHINELSNLAIDAVCNKNEATINV